MGSLCVSKNEVQMPVEEPVGIYQCHFSNGDGVEKSSSRNCFDFLRFEMPILMSAFRQNMFGLNFLILSRILSHSVPSKESMSLLNRKLKCLTQKDGFF